MSYWENYEWMHEGDSGDEAVKNGCIGSIVYIVLFWLMLFLLCVMTSCTTTRYVPVIEHRTDTLIITKQQRDSIWLHDSIHVLEWSKGDTVFVEVAKLKTKYVESIKHDTIYQSRVDSIPQPYPVPEYIEKQLSWWQKTRLRMGEILIGLIVLIGLIGLIKLKTKIWP